MLERTQKSEDNILYIGVRWTWLVCYFALLFKFYFINRSFFKAAYWSDVLPNRFTRLQSKDPLTRLRTLILNQPLSPLCSYFRFYLIYFLSDDIAVNVGPKYFVFVGLSKIVIVVGPIASVCFATQILVNIHHFVKHIVHFNLRS